MSEHLRPPSDVDPPLLRGVRVLEVDATLRTRFCGRVLADVGADIASASPPWAPNPTGSTDDERRFERWLQDGKTELGPVDRDDALAALVRDADVLIDGSDPGSTAHRAIGRLVGEVARESLIHTRLSSFGQDGPARSWHASPLNAYHFSATGHRYVGAPDRAPLTIGGDQSEVWCGLNGAIASLVAVHERIDSGRGQSVDVSGAESLGMLFVSFMLITDWALQRDAGQGFDANFERPDMSRRYRHFPCVDGLVHIAALSSPEFRRLMDLIDAPDWLREIGGSAHERTQNEDVVNLVVAEWTQSRTRDEIMRACLASRVPAAPVVGFSDYGTDPQYVARHYLSPFEDRDGSVFEAPSPPFRVDGRRPGSRP